MLLSCYSACELNEHALSLSHKRYECSFYCCENEQNIRTLIMLNGCSLLSTALTHACDIPAAHTAIGAIYAKQ